MASAISFERRVVFWIGAMVAFMAVVWLLHEILLPFVAGMALAYLFNPLANRLQRAGIDRLVASLVIIGVFVLSFIILLLIIVPILGGQLSAFIDNLPAYVQRLQSVVGDPSRPWLRRMLGESFATGDGSLTELVTQGAGWLTGFLKSLWSGGQALISVFSLMVVMPVVAFYVLYDWDRMIATVDSWIPVPHRETVRELARQIDLAIAGVVRGQTGVCLILGSLYALGLTLVGLNFGLLIGLVSGLITFIPYVGSMTGLVLSTGVAVAQFWPNYTAILIVVTIFFVGQFIEGYILTPKLVGRSVGLHPVWLMFALFAFGYLLGFVGMLLAVPLAAAIGVITRFALQQYMGSTLYTGESEEKSKARAARSSQA